MLLLAPMWMGSLSPRSTAFHQMETLSPRRASPITVALGATQALAAIWGVFWSIL